MADDLLNDAVAELFAVDREARAFGLGLLAVGVVLIILAARRWRLDRRRTAARRARIAARRVDFAAGRSSGAYPDGLDWQPMPVNLRTVGARIDETQVTYRVEPVGEPGQTVVIPRQRGDGRG